MAFPHAPLDAAQLGPAAAKLVGPDAPAPMRGMVAKGLAPLPPRDLLVALYQLWATNDPEHAQTAGATVAKLPPPILDGALADPNLPPGVLDFLGRKLLDKPEWLEKVVRHPKVDDETLVAVARVAPEGVCEVVAENQVRWLACPKIVESLFHNPKCRMSTVHRVLELAVREGLDLHLPNLDEIRQALAEEGGAPDPERDEVFRAAAEGAAAAEAERAAALAGAAATDAVDLEAVAARTDEAPDELFADDGGDLDLPVLDEEGAESPDAGEAAKADGGSAADGRDEPAERRFARRIDAATFSKLRPMEKIRLALLGDAFERSLAIRDSNRAVAMSAIKSPRVKENEVVNYSANRTLPHDVIRYIAGRRDWIKLYAVKLNLVMNPKTPMAVAMSLLGHLQPQDLRKVAKSRNIPSALQAAAKRRLGQRR